MAAPILESNRSSTYLNSITFNGYSDNIMKTYLAFLETYKQESDGLFIVRNVGETAVTTDQIREQDMSQYAHDKPQGKDAQRLEFGEAYYKEIIAQRIGAQLNISYEMRVANRFEIGQAIKRFNASVPNRMELDRQHRLGFANVTSYVNMDGRVVDTTAGDGLAYGSATHPLAFSTTTWSNIVPSNPQLSLTALEAAEKLGVTDVLDNYGLPVYMEFTHVAVNKQDPQTVRILQEILRSTTLITQANPGVVNTFQQKYQPLILSRVATDALGRPDSTKYKWWSLLALTGFNRFQAYEYVWEAPHMNPMAMGANNGVDSYNDDYTFGSRARYSHAVVSARGSIFSFAS